MGQNMGRNGRGWLEVADICGFWGSMGVASLPAASPRPDVFVSPDGRSSQQHEFYPPIQRHMSSQQGCCGTAQHGPAFGGGVDELNILFLYIISTHGSMQEANKNNQLQAKRKAMCHEQRHS